MRSFTQFPNRMPPHERPRSPTGIVSNVSNDLPSAGMGIIFLFATLDGTISPPQANRNEAILAVDNSANKSWGLPSPGVR